VGSGIAAGDGCRKGRGEEGRRQMVQVESEGGGVVVAIVCEESMRAFGCAAVLKAGTRVR
jgi:hypothetical protein